MKRMSILLFVGCLLCTGIFTGCKSVSQEKNDVRAKPLPRECFSDQFWMKAAPERVHALVSEGGDINERGRNGWTPLMWAAKSSPDPDVITALLSHAADFMVEAKDGTTVFTLLENNKDLKDSDIHKQLEGWRLNNFYHEKALEEQKRKQDAERDAP